MDPKPPCLTQVQCPSTKTLSAVVLHRASPRTTAFPQRELPTTTTRQLKPLIITALPHPPSSFHQRPASYYPTSILIIPRLTPRHFSVELSGDRTTLSPSLVPLPFHYLSICLSVHQPSRLFSLLRPSTRPPTHAHPHPGPRHLGWSSTARSDLVSLHVRRRHGRLHCLIGPGVSSCC